MSHQTLLFGRLTVHAFQIAQTVKRFMTQLLVHEQEKLFTYNHSIHVGMIKIFIRLVLPSF